MIFLEALLFIAVPIFGWLALLVVLNICSNICASIRGNPHLKLLANLLNTLDKLMIQPLVRIGQVLIALIYIAPFLIIMVPAVIIWIFFGELFGSNNITDDAGDDDLYYSRSSGLRAWWFH